MDFSGLSLESFSESILAFLPRLALAILIYLAARLLSRWLTRLVRQALERQAVDREVVLLLQMMTRWGIIVLGVILALEQLAPGRLTALLAGVGVLGFTLGFALQDVARNFIAGILLLVTQPFEIGDTVDILGSVGKIEAINLRMVVMRAVDGRYLMIPNSEVLSSSIVNFSRSPHRRLEFDLSVANQTDLEQAARAAIDAIAENRGVLDEPAPQVAFQRFGDFAIEGVLRYWVDTGKVDFLDAHQEGVRAIQTAFDEAKIDMPFPTSEVRLQDQSS